MRDHWSFVQVSLDHLKATRLDRHFNERIRPSFGPTSSELIYYNSLSLFGSVFRTRVLDAWRVRGSRLLFSVHTVIIVTDAA